MATTVCSGSNSGLFTMLPVGSGLNPDAAELIVRGLLEPFNKDELVKRGYQPVYTPHIGRLEPTDQWTRLLPRRSVPADVRLPPRGRARHGQYRSSSLGVVDEEEREVQDYFALDSTSRSWLHRR